MRQWKIFRTNFEMDMPSVIKRSVNTFNFKCAFIFLSMYSFVTSVQSTLY